MRRAVLVLVLVGALVGTAGTPGQAVGASAPAACGQNARQTPVIRHVIVVLMENHGYPAIIGHAPFIDSLAHRCGLATDYHAITHPSLPNYLALTSGSTHGITSDCDPSVCPISGRSIFSQVTAHRLGWRSYAESMPVACDMASTGLYAARHVPSVYYLSVRSICQGHVRALGTLGGGRLHAALNSGHAPAYIFVTPNLCDDMHDCSVATGDAWLSRWVPMMVASRCYRAGHAAILLTWDEDSGGDNRVPLIAVSRYTPAGRVSSAPLNHYALLRATEHILGFHRFLGHASVFSGLSRAFHL